MGDFYGYSEPGKIKYLKEECPDLYLLMKKHWDTDQESNRELRKFVASEAFNLDKTSGKRTFILQLIWQFATLVLVVFLISASIYLVNLGKDITGLATLAVTIFGGGAIQVTALVLKSRIERIQLEKMRLSLDLKLKEIDESNHGKDQDADRGGTNSVAANRDAAAVKKAK